ncbi:Dbl homology domain-containing protein [Rickenella mellea]|uniref:Dbl homology domain-containing protein n=1 Tax=Rickenella mellea TaxID=50990 RepID=A0A4R5XHY4_9AGAM|nr:Dbl homology domain-containing protein [Rickenella mellea]
MSSQDASAGSASGKPKTIFTIAAGSSESLNSDGENVRAEEHESWRTSDAVDKNDVRRFYALMELFNTEIGYVNDLKILVEVCVPSYELSGIAFYIRGACSQVYLENLQTLTALPRTRSTPTIHRPSRRHSTIVSGPDPANLPTRSLSYSRFGASGSVHTDPNDLPHNDTPVAGTSTAGSLFTNEETLLLRRNASALLDMHKRLVSALKRTLKHVGYKLNVDQELHPSHNLKPTLKRHSGTRTTRASIHDAIAAVSDIFHEQASEFNLYELFCAGHTEVLDLIRRVQQSHPVQWDKWEKACAAQVTAVQSQSPTKISSSRSSSKSDIVFNHDDGPGHAAKSQTSASLCRRHNSLPSAHSSSSFVLLGSSAPSSSQSLSSLNSNGEPSQEKAPRPLKHTNSDPTRSGRGQARLSFVDYLIKPVQRICKYPLLLEQLRSAKPSWPRRGALEDKAFNNLSVPSRNSSGCSADAMSTAGSSADGSVDRALVAMRGVALAVDEARRRNEIETKSRLIATRITAQPRSPFSTTFIDSLGASLLAGSLDVVYARSEGGEHLEGIHAHHARSRISGPVKVKYLGAFLYVGGYIVLAKIVKANVYEVKHWFPLAGTNLVDIEEEDALLPCSFRLECGNQFFEFAAACDREKAVWMEAITEAWLVPSAWKEEPVSSLLTRGGHGHSRRGSEVTVPPFTDEPAAAEPMPPLSSIVSEPEPAQITPQTPLSTSHPPSAMTPARSSSNGHRRSDSITSTPTHRHQHQPPSRSTSNLMPSLPRSNTTTSVRSIFSSASSSDASTILIRRCSAARRTHVDRLLLDVFAEPCLAARQQAQKQGEELFRDPKAGTEPLGRGIAAKNRLTRRESVLVPRQRPVGITTTGAGIGSGVDVDGASGASEAESAGPAGTGVGTAKSIARHRRNRSSLRVTPTLATLFTETEDGSESVSLGLVPRTSPVSPESPNALSQSSDPPSLCSSATNSHGNSSDGVNKHTVKSIHPPPDVHVYDADDAPQFLENTRIEDVSPYAFGVGKKRPRSLIDGVRDLFLSVPPPMPYPSRAHSSAVNLSLPPGHSQRCAREQRAQPQSQDVPHILSRLWRLASLRRLARTTADSASPTKKGSKSRSRFPPPVEYLVHSPSSPSLPRKRHYSDNNTTDPRMAAKHRRRSVFYQSGSEVSSSLRRTSFRRSMYANTNSFSLSPLTPVVPGPSSPFQSS